VSRIARLTLELDIDAQPVSGQLQLDGSIPRDFDGWLELTSLIETIRNTAKAAANADNRVEHDPARPIESGPTGDNSATASAKGEPDGEPI
jgi:hypothetical protein